MDIIERLDLLEPNDYSPEQKLRWLWSLDGRIYREVIQTHEPTLPDLFGAYDDGDAELLIEEPYALDVYSNYLLAKNYIETLQSIASGPATKTVYLPYEASNLMGSIGGIKDMFKMGD